MNRYARPAKKGQSRQQEDDQDEQPSVSPDMLPIGSQHLMTMTPLGRPPRGEEEKRAVYLDLIRLKENRLTNKECAEKLGVSERTVANYLIDPLYQELWHGLVADATAHGRLLIADVIPEAVNKLYGLMHTARSEFVQYKSAEYLLKISGYEQEQAAVQRDDQGEVIAFLNKLKERPNRVQVNIQVNNTPGGATGSAEVIDTTAQLVSPVSEEDELAEYRTPMLPGGKIPTSQE